MLASDVNSAVMLTVTQVAAMGIIVGSLLIIRQPNATQSVS